MTNLAIKGIIGVRAMAEIARAVGRDSDVTEYGVSECKLLLAPWVRIFRRGITNCEP